MIGHSVFTEKNVTKALVRFAIPGVITILMAELYNMVDTFFVGRYVGADAVGAMSIAFPIQRLIIAISLMIGVGGATRISRALGEKNKDKLKESIRSAAFLGIIILGMVPLVFFVFSSEILSALGARGNIYTLSKSYLNIVVLGSLFLGFTNIFGYTITAMGNPKVTLISTSLGAIINIIVDFALVGIFDFGVEGAAISTLVSQMVAFSYSFFMIHRMSTREGFDLSPRYAKSASKSIIVIGFATFIVEISDAVVIGLLNNILLPIGGNDAVVIVGAITRVSMFMYITIIGISAGMQPLASYSYGSKDYDRLNEIVKKTIKMVLLSSTVLWGAIMYFAPALIGSFLKDEAILNQTISAFRQTIVVFPIISIYYVSIYYCQSIGKGREGFVLSIYRQMILFLPLVVVMVNVFGMNGAWWTYPITDILSALTGIYFIGKSKRELYGERESGFKKDSIKKLKQVPVEIC